MKNNHYSSDGTTPLYVTDEEPECGKAFCDECGDCLSCDTGDSCFNNGEPASEHIWVTYEKLVCHQVEARGELLLENCILTEIRATVTAEQGADGPVVVYERILGAQPFWLVRYKFMRGEGLTWGARYSYGSIASFVPRGESARTWRIKAQDPLVTLQAMVYRNDA